MNRSRSRRLNDLHQLILRTHEEYKKHLIYQHYIHNHKTDGNASFLRAARAGNLEKVLEYLKGSIDINTSNANGLNALHLASKEGYVTVVTELLKRGANVNAATKKGNTALHIASLAGQDEVVKVLVQNGSNVNALSLTGFSPLYMAAQENHDSLVRYLLANGANQSLATEDGFTPLAVALQQGHDRVVAILLENDTKGKVRLPALHVAAKKDDCKAAAVLLDNNHNPDVTSKSGFTPLHIAAHYGNENIAKLLLDKNADVNFEAKHQITPLHVASKWGKSNMVTLLLERNAKIDAATSDGLTPLHCAARSGHDSVVELLLDKGAPISSKTKNGLAPLHMAAQGDHVDSARILLFHKAPVDDVTVDYLTALHVAAHCGHVRVAKLLLDRKAEANARASNGFTPLHIACKKNRIKVVELLLKHGASLEATTESGLTPLHVAAFMGCMNIVIYLIQHGANPNAPTVRGESPLHLAARANQTDIIRILLRNGAQVDAKAREQQTPLHIASRLGNTDIVGLLLQHGASVDSLTNDLYTSLHIAAKEGQEEVASVLLDNGASLTATTKKGFTPLHLAAKYGNIKVARLLLSKESPVDAQGKNNVTPLHCAAHYDHVNVALLLLEKGASPHATAKNGYCPLHIAAHKNQMDIATTLLEYGAKANAESKAGFTPLHLAAQEGHTDMATLLIGHQANVNARAKNSLTPLHLCSQEDRVNVASILVKNRADIGPQTKAGHTPLHVACHFGQINMVRFLLQNGADVNATNAHGYTPLHQAAQQGHTLIVNLLLENKASPNAVTNQGQTPLSIAQRLGYISVVETLKVVTETTVTTTTVVSEEKYKVVAPETMQETFMSDSEEEGGEEFVEETTLFSGNAAHSSHVYLPFYESHNLHSSDDNMLGDQSYRYLTADEMKSLGDDSMRFDVTKDERGPDLFTRDTLAPITVEEEHFSPHHMMMTESYVNALAPDNVDISRAPITAGTHFKYRYMDFSDKQQLWHNIHGRPLDPYKRMRRSRRLKWKTFLVSFMVDARGGAMRGCRHSGVRVIIPPRKASMPMRITCRYLRKEKLIHPPPLMEGEACASRLLEVGPAGAKFLGPVILEVPHFASLRGKEREIIILRSDNGETWREHTLEASEEAVQEVLNESFEGENDVNALDDFSSNRITRILTTDFPQYFAIITRIRQEVHAIGPEGGMVSSTVVPQVQAIFPEGALTKKIKVGLQAQPIPTDLVTKMLGNRVAVSPICTIEPRRRKFHKPITLTIPVPQAATRGMINQYSGDAPTLRLLCSITGSTKSGGTTKAQWEDVTGSTPLTFVNDCVSFTTTVSARFWLIDCRQVNEATKFATELYSEAIHVPFMSKFVVFAKRYEPQEAHVRVFCMTDDKEEKTLENQEHFTEVAKSRDVEVLETKPQYLEFAGNLVPVTKSGEQLSLTFQAFRENRLPFVMRVKDPNQEPLGRIAFMREYKKVRQEQPQIPICNLNIELPEICREDGLPSDFVTVEKNYDFIKESKLSTPEMIAKADLSFADVSKALGNDWVNLAYQLDVPQTEIEKIQTNFPDNNKDQSLAMLRYWSATYGPVKASGNALERGLRSIRREDIIVIALSNAKPATDSLENAIHKIGAEQNVFDSLKDELGPSRNTSRGASLPREVSLDVSYDEPDIMKEAESAEESGSEAGVSSLRSHSNSAERDRGRHASVSETDEEESERKRLEDNSDRAIAAQKFLEFLEEEDKEESETRAKYRGEDINSQSQQDLFVVREEMMIPVDMQANSFDIIEEPIEVRTTETTSVLDDGTIKHTITTVTKTTVVQDQSEPLTLDPTARLLETETWHSGEQDTSQVSVSSLPEDEKSEPSTATVSSTTTTHTGDNIASALVTTSLEDEPHFDVMIEQKEWTEEDESGAVAHIIEQSSSFTTENGGDKFQMSSHDVIEDTESDSQTLSFNEKKNFFEKLSSDAPNDSPQNSRDNRGARKSSSGSSGSSSIDEQFAKNSKMGVTDRGEVVDEEQLSFQDKMRFFRNSISQESNDSSSKLDLKRADSDTTKSTTVSSEKLLDFDRQETSYVESQKFKIIDETDAKQVICETNLVVSEERVSESNVVDDSVAKDEHMIEESYANTNKFSSTNTASSMADYSRDLKHSLVLEREFVESQSSLEVEVGSRNSNDNISPDSEKTQTFMSDAIFINNNNAVSVSTTTSITASSTATITTTTTATTTATNNEVISEMPDSHKFTAETETTTKTDSKCSPTANMLEKQQIPHTYPPSNVGLDDHDECDKSLLPKPSPPEVVSVIDEQYSPVVDYSTYASPELQVKVGISPTEDSLTNEKSAETDSSSKKERKISFDETNVTKPSSIDYVNSELAYENDAFAGAENIDSESVDSGERSPYEVVREDIDLTSSIEKSFSQQQTVPKYFDEQSIETDLTENTTTTTSDQTSPQIISTQMSAQDTKQLDGNVVKHIVSEIFAKELEEEVVNGSPERKIIHKTEQMEQRVDSDSTIEQSEQIIVEEKVKTLKFDENVRSISEDTVEHNIMTASNDAIYDEELRREASLIAQSIVGKATEELLKRPHLVHEYSDISDEDLVEKFGDEDKFISDDFEDKVMSDELISPCNDLDEQSVESAKQSQSQKRISFTEHDTFIIKEESFDSTVNEKSSTTDYELKKSLSDARKSSDSGSRSSGSQKEKESGSSPESHYQSFEVSDSSKTPATSRPTSSEFDLNIIPEHYCLSSGDGSGGSGGAVGGLSASDYETCATSQEEGSYLTATSQPHSQDTISTYNTAQSHVSSRESTLSIESESSGHMGEISSEASETIIPLEEKETLGSLSDDDYDQNGSNTPVNEFKEPFDCDIPESIIRSGVELPFMSGANWEMVEQTGDRECASVLSTFEIITSEELEDFAPQPPNTAPVLGLLRQSNSVDDSEQLSESNSLTWRSSVGTIIPAPGFNQSGDANSIGHGSGSGCTDSMQSVFRSFSDSVGSLENLNAEAMPQQTVQISETLTYSNGPIEVEYNPEYDVSDSERTTITAAITAARHQSTSQDERTSSSDVASDGQISTDTPLVSQSSLCSSVLSEHTRHQLSYDLSPDLHMCVAESLTVGSDDLQQRPQSPVPPEAEDLVYLDITKESSGDLLRKLSPITQEIIASTTTLESDKEVSHETHSSEHVVDLYTHQEVDEDFEESAMSKLVASKAISFPSSSRSTESSASSSLKEFERLETEMLSRGRGSHHGSNDSIGSSLGSGKPIQGRLSDRDDFSVSSSLMEFEKLEKDYSETERAERIAQEEAARLSEIEEGHESLSSEASQETISNQGNSDDDETDTDYEKRISEIDDIIKKTQVNVESIHRVSSISDNTITTSESSQQSIEVVAVTDNVDFNDDKINSQKFPNNQTQSANAAHIMLSRKIVSTESIDSHPRSSISTTNTESLIGRMEELDESRVEDKDSIDGSKDPNKSFDADSLQDDNEKPDPDRDSLQDPSELPVDYSSEATTSTSTNEGPFSNFVQEVLTFASFESAGPALATLREENDFDDDSLKESFHGVLKGGECMLSSTDSLEPTSSQATFAAYHYGSEAAMSSSYQTSVDDTTMISSGEMPDLLFGASPDLLGTIEESYQFSESQNEQLRRIFESNPNDDSEPLKAEPNVEREQCDTGDDDQYEEIHSYDEKGNLTIFKRIKRMVPPQQFKASTSSENEEKFFEMLKRSVESGSEEIEEQRTIDDNGDIIVKRTVRRVATQGPDIRSRVIIGDSADEENEQFLAPFTKLESTVNVEEYEGVDESGNPYKVIQEVTITPEVRTVTFTGPDAEQKVEEFLSTWSGDKNQLKEITTPFSASARHADTAMSDSVKSMKQSDFGKFNGQSDNKDQNGCSQRVATGSTRVVTECVSEENGHTTTMETTVHHSSADDEPQIDQIRNSMQQVIDQFMNSEEDSK